MISFFKVLFFSKIVLLTPEPVSIESVYEQEFDEPISALTSTADLRIDISAMLEENGVTDLGNLIEVENKVDQLFPNKTSVRIRFYTEDGENIEGKISGHSLGNNQVYLVLFDHVPVETEFHKMRLETDVYLSNVSISWKNFSL